MSVELLTRPKVDTAKFEGKVLDWNLIGSVKYISGIMRYGRLRQFVEADIFSIDSPEGEQRQLNERKVKSLVKAMKAGKYVPTTFSIGTRPVHRDRLEYTETKKNVSLILEEGEKAPLLDANHRKEALERIRAEGGNTTRAVDNLYIPYIMYLDGDTREFFLALQDGLPVNKAHMFSLRTQNDFFDNKVKGFYQLGNDAAKILHNDSYSCFGEQIRFDSSSTKYRLSIVTLMTKKETDLIFSLYGGAKIAIQHKKDARWLASMVNEAYNALTATDESMALMGQGKLLQPAPDGKNIGSYYMIALGNSLAARCWLKGIDEPTEEDLELLMETAIANLDKDASMHTTGKPKYTPYHEFAQDFFADLEPSLAEQAEMEDSETDISTKMLAFHKGIPVPLINCLSASTFGVEKMVKPKLKRKKGRKATSGIKIEVEAENEEEDEVVRPSVHVDDPDFDEEDNLKERGETE